MTKTAPSPVALPQRVSGRLAILIKGLWLAVLLTFGAEAARTAFGSNFRTVVSGRCYRCAQPSSGTLRMLARHLGIRSVINLRGFEDEPWYLREQQLGKELGFRMVDQGMWAARPPTEDEMREIVHSVGEAEEPILIHCVSGIDRSGIVAAMYLLLRTDATVDQAAAQLSVRFGHNPWGKTACQDRVLAAYAAWLDREGLRHRPDHFRRWANNVYRQEVNPEWTVIK
jgi:protein tyrosine phosphatase (PTP) superfamily phosphohydrolase (DUF442 family)